MKLECDSVTFSRGNGSRIKLFLKSTCLTDELCHCAIFEANDVTSTYLFRIQQNLVLSFKVALLFVCLFNKLFMTKCEQVFDWN